MTSEQEAQKIIEIAEGRPLAALEIVERQLGVLHTRAQVLVSLAGVVVTVTGFSGRLIASTSDTAQGFLVLGLVVVLSGAVLVLVRVMPLRWVTGELDGPLQGTISRIIERRNCKTAVYRLGSWVVGIGLALYAIAIAIMLLNPALVVLPVR